MWVGSVRQEQTLSLTLLPEYFLLLRHVVQCIGTVLGPGVRRSELQSCLHRLLDFRSWRIPPSRGDLIRKAADLPSRLPLGTPTKKQRRAVCDLALQTAVTTQRRKCSDCFVSKVSSNFAFHDFIRERGLVSQVGRRGQQQRRVSVLIILFLTLLLDTACNKNQQNQPQTSPSPFS